MTLIRRLIAAVGLKRLVVLALAPGMLTLAFDAGVGHFAGHSSSNVLQYVPVVYAIVATLLLLAVSVVAVPPKAFARVLQVVGALSAAVGAVGVALHGWNILESLKDEEAITLKVVWKTLGLCPPLFAPGAFLGFGVLLVVWPSIADALERSRKATATATARLAPCRCVLPRWRERTRRVARALISRARWGAGLAGASAFGAGAGARPSARGPASPAFGAGAGAFGASPASFSHLPPSLVHCLWVFPAISAPSFMQ